MGAPWNQRPGVLDGRILLWLLKRLLNKQPPKRRTRKEVNHHPWVLHGISDQVSWMDESGYRCRAKAERSGSRRTKHCFFRLFFTWMHSGTKQHLMQSGYCIRNSTIFQSKLTWIPERLASNSKQVTEVLIANRARVPNMLCFAGRWLLSGPLFHHLHTRLAHSFWWARGCHRLHPE